MMDDAFMVSDMITINARLTEQLMWQGKEATRQRDSFVQPGAFGHMHKVLHALGHLPAQAIDVVVVIHPRRSCFESRLEAVFCFTPGLLRQGKPQPMPHP